MGQKKKLLLTLLLFGSLWGFLEAAVTMVTDGVGGVVPRSTILAGLALVILIFARVVLPRAGTTLAIGIIAAGFKFLGLPELYTCQLAGVIGQALILDIALSLAEHRGWSHSQVKLAAVVVVAAYANATVFCFSQAYVFANHWWLERGVSGLWTWVATHGSLAAIASLLGFVLASFAAARSLEWITKIVRVREAAFGSLAAVISLCCWTAGVAIYRF